MYVFSIVDANGIAKLRVKAWERIETGQPPRPRKGMTRAAVVEGRPAGGGGGMSPPTAGAKGSQSTGMDGETASQAGRGQERMIRRREHGSGASPTPGSCEDAW